MNFKICYLTSHQIVPGHTIMADYSKELTLISKNQWILLEALDQLEITWKNQSQRVERGTAVIGKGFQIINPCMGTASFRGIVFLAGNNKDFINSPGFIPAESSLKYLFVRRIMDHPTHTNDDLSIVESLFDQLVAIFVLENESSSAAINKRLTGRMDTRLLIVNRYIRKHYDQPLTLPNLAELIGCNPVYLSNMYSRIFKVSPMKYLQNVRMQKALALITSTNLGILEIAQRLGYISNSQFGVLFKRYHGMTPYEYRVKHRMSEKVREGE